MTTHITIGALLKRRPDILTCRGISGRYIVILPPINHVAGRGGPAQIIITIFRLRVLLIKIRPSGIPVYPLEPECFRLDNTKTQQQKN